jgi:hypothetical protein
MIDSPRNIVFGYVVSPEDIPGLRQLTNHLLEPKLEGLVDDDEVHLVRVDVPIISLQLQQLM